MLIFSNAYGVLFIDDLSQKPETQQAAQYLRALKPNIGEADLGFGDAPLLRLDDIWIDDEHPFAPYAMVLSQITATFYYQADKTDLQPKPINLQHNIAWHIFRAITFLGHYEIFSFNWTADEGLSSKCQHVLGVLMPQAPPGFRTYCLQALLLDKEKHPNTPSVFFNYVEEVTIK